MLGASFTLQGEQTDEQLLTPMGVGVAIREGNVVIEDEEMWQPGALPFPSVAVIAAGRLVYKDAYLWVEEQEIGTFYAVTVRPGPMRGVCGLMASRHQKVVNVCAAFDDFLGRVHGAGFFAPTDNRRPALRLIMGGGAK